MSGGFDSKTYYSDAYLFNTKTQRWSVAIEHNYRNEGFSCFDAIQVAPGHVIALVRDSHKQPHAIEYKSSTNRVEFLWQFNVDRPEGRLRA